MEKKFIDKPFAETEGGYYDENNFYITANGSFWDPDGVYFNSDGVDKHGGYYDSNLEYHPGKGWIPSLMCYEDEREESENIVDISEDKDNEEKDNDDILDELFTNAGMDFLEGKTVFKPTTQPLNPGVKEQKIDVDTLFNTEESNDNPIKKEEKSKEDLKEKEKVKVEKKISVDELFG